MLQSDSGFVILRRYDRSYVAIFRTEEQQHGFNHPFQLSMDPAEGDTPDDAICVSIAVRVGDIVLAASDGLLDNVFEEELVRSVNQAKQNGTLLTDLPDRLAELAITRGENSTFHSPFAAKAESNGYTFKGGKLDDTTIIIA